MNNKHLKEKAQRTSAGSGDIGAPMRQTSSLTRLVRWVPVVLVVTVFAALGVRLLLLTHASSPGISISGNSFLLNGQAFTPHGFNSIALLDSQWCSNSLTAAAKQNYSSAELSNAKNKWAANTIRFQVSQPVLASGNGSVYAHQIASDVAIARQAGLVVDIAMADDDRACGHSEPLPSSPSSGDTDHNTETAWRNLINNTSLKDDPDIMFELYSSPNNQPDAKMSSDPTVWNWPDWLNGGRRIKPQNSSQNWSAYTPVGHEGLVIYMRNSLGVGNVLLAGGAGSSEYFQGVPVLSDPDGRNQIGYALEPYIYNDGQSSWQTRWGNLSGSQVVLGVEWNCTGTSSQTADLLGYMRTNVHVGVLGQALDMFGSRLMADTSLNPTSCGHDFQNDYTNYFLPPPAPRVSITSPGNGAKVSGSSVTVSAKASISSGSIMRVELLAAGNSLSTCNGSSCSTTWNTRNESNGNYPVTAIATSSAGVTDSTTETVTVANAPGTISAPTGVSSPSQTDNSITLHWNASQDSRFSATQLIYQIFVNGKSAVKTISGASGYTLGGLTPGTTYMFTVVGIDPAGGTSAPSAAFQQATQKSCQGTPAAPKGLGTANVAGTSIALRWQTVPAPSASCRIAQYAVERGGVVIADPTGPSYVDSGVLPGRTYTYAVLAIASDHTAGKLSSSITVTTPHVNDTTPPSAPTGLVATPLSDTQVDLTWSPSSDPQSGIAQYNILRGGSNVGSAPASATPDFGDSGLNANTTYTYRVVAVNGSGLTATSASVSVTTLANSDQTNSATGSSTSVGAGSDTGQAGNLSGPAAGGTQQPPTVGSTQNATQHSGALQTVAKIGGTVTVSIIGVFAIAWLWLWLHRWRYGTETSDPDKYTLLEHNPNPYPPPVPPSSPMPPESLYPPDSDSPNDHHKEQYP